MSALVDGLHQASDSHVATGVQLELLDVRANIKPGEENHAVSARATHRARDRHHRRRLTSCVVRAGLVVQTSSFLHWLSGDAVGRLVHLFLGGNSWPPAPFGQMVAAAISLPALDTLDCSAIDMQGDSELPSVICDAMRQQRARTRLRALSLANNRMDTAHTVGRGDWPRECGECECACALVDQPRSADLASGSSVAWSSLVRLSSLKWCPTTPP